MQETAGTQAVRSPKPKRIKCVVWDLDNTLWDGTLLEDPSVRVRPDALTVIRTLDERGILHSLASRNDKTKALARLLTEGLHDWFLHPQINWNSKSDSLRKIATSLRLGLDTFAFIDDDPFERAEMSATLPEVTVLEPTNLLHLLELPEMNPAVITEDAKMRRLMYMAEMKREQAEQVHTGSNEDFLASLNMSVSIAPCAAEDLARAEELIVRTNQLNSTGYTYCHEELQAMCNSPEYLVLMAGLSDRFGTYGKIGLAVVKIEGGIWRIKLLLVSCRVMSRGVAPILLNTIIAAAHGHGKTLQADFVSNDVNRPMQILLRLAGFQYKEQSGSCNILQIGGNVAPKFPVYVKIESPWVQSQCSLVH
jgi:FkbH-like protein